MNSNQLKTKKGSVNMDKLTLKKHDMYLRLANLTDDPEKKRQYECRAFDLLPARDKEIRTLLGWSPYDRGKIICR